MTSRQHLNQVVQLQTTASFIINSSFKLNLLPAPPCGEEFLKFNQLHQNFSSSSSDVSTYRCSGWTTGADQSCAWLETDQWPEEELAKQPGRENPSRPSRFSLSETTDNFQSHHSVSCLCFITENNQILFYHRSLGCSCFGISECQRITTNPKFILQNKSTLRRGRDFSCWQAAGKEHVKLTRKAKYFRWNNEVSLFFLCKIVSYPVKEPRSVLVSTVMGAVQVL